VWRHLYIGWGSGRELFNQCWQEELQKTVLMYRTCEQYIKITPKQRRLLLLTVSLSPSRTLCSLKAKELEVKADLKVQTAAPPPTPQPTASCARWGCPVGYSGTFKLWVAHVASGWPGSPPLNPSWNLSTEKKHLHSFSFFKIQGYLTISLLQLLHSGMSHA